MQHYECNHLQDSVRPAAIEAHNLNDPLPTCSYLHREGTREYMQAEVMPHVQRALEALALRIQEERLKLAAGVEAEEGKYLPRGWRPFCPHRWMAEYLIAHKPHAAGTGAAMAVAKLLQTADTAALAAAAEEQHME